MNIQGTPDKKVRGQQADIFSRYITVNICLVLEYCCKICYIKSNKGTAAHKVVDL